MNKNIVGAIAGDIIGSIYEWNNVKSIGRIKHFDRGCRFTDDTVLTCAVADWIMEANSADGGGYGERRLARNLKKYGKRYRGAGYGHLFREWLDSDSDEPFNSYGNGAGMRVSPVGYFCDTVDDAKKWAKASAEVTHNHPEGIKGAQAIACAIVLAKNGKSKEEIKEYTENEFGYDLNRKITDMVNFYNDDMYQYILSRKHKFDATCQVTVPEAIIAFLESKDYRNAIDLALLIGGDSDTIACMTGGIAAAYYGIPEDIEERALALLPDDLFDIVKKFNEYLDRNSVTETEHEQPEI